MEITTLGGKQTIDPPMPSNEENVRKDDDKVVKVVLRKKRAMEKMQNSL